MVIQSGQDIADFSSSGGGGSLCSAYKSFKATEKGWD